MSRLRRHEVAVLHCVGYVAAAALGFLGGWTAQPSPRPAARAAVTPGGDGVAPCATAPAWCRPLFPSYPRSDVGPVVLTPAPTPLTGPTTVTERPRR